MLYKGDPEDQTSIYYFQARSGLKKAILPETFLVSLYRCLTPYRGCGFGCLYCDGRSEKYYVDGDFEYDIAVRKNLPELIEKQVKSHFTKKEFGSVNMGSGVTDIYQLVEKSSGLTRRLLEILKDAEVPIVILTKSSLVLRDFDLLKQFPKCLLIMTITTLDKDMKSLLEPNSSQVEERLEVIEKAREAGFYTGVMAMPLCPSLSDTLESTRKMFLRIKERGAQFIYPGGLTLRPGRQKNFFFDGIRSSCDSSLYVLYENIYKENRESGMPDKSYARAVYSSWQNVLQELEMPGMIPYQIYRDLLSPPDYIYVLLEHMQTLYKDRGIDIRSLINSKEKYAQWLKGIRTRLRRKRITYSDAFPFQITKAMGLELERANLSEILENRKLAKFITTLLKENVIFDYVTLKIKDC